MLLKMVHKQTLLNMSNVAVLGAVALAAMATWSHTAFKQFVASNNCLLWLGLLLSEHFFRFLMIVVGAKTEKKEKKINFAGTSLSEARSMRLVTAACDYLFVGGMFLFFSSSVFVANGPLCPFRGTCAQLFLVTGLLMKEEFQCRVLWKKHVSPKKINYWPYTMESAVKHLYCSPSWIFYCLSHFALLSGGKVDVAFQSGVVGLLLTWSRIWLETMCTVLVLELFAHFGHRWMHEKAYFLHKKHHGQKHNLTVEGTLHFDHFDVVIEFFAGAPLVIVLKWLLGLSPTVHFFSHALFLVLGMHTHSGNPYTTYFFNPILDLCMRPVLCHNLHHTVQVGYYTQIPFSHLFNKKSRANDIDLYNKHMKTHFPLEL